MFFFFLEGGNVTNYSEAMAYGRSFFWRILVGGFRVLLVAATCSLSLSLNIHVYMLHIYIYIHA